MSSVGIIGAGKIGLTIARFTFMKGYKTILYDIDPSKLSIAKTKGYRVTSTLKELVGEGSYIVIATPSRNVGEIIEKILRISKRISLNGKTLFDTTTFKKEIVNLYKKIPKTAYVASIHPLFGPGAKNATHHTIAVIPIPGREEGALKTAEFIKSLGFKTIIVDHETHDKIMGTVIGGSYAIAVAVASLIEETDNPELTIELAGTTFKHLLIHLKSILNDDNEFIKYILNNTNTHNAVKTIIKSMQQIIETPNHSIKTLSKTRQYFTRKEIEEAYRRLYKCIEE